MTWYQKLSIGSLAVAAAILMFFSVKNFVYFVEKTEENVCIVDANKRDPIKESLNSYCQYSKRTTPF